MKQKIGTTVRIIDIKYYSEAWKIHHQIISTVAPLSMKKDAEESKSDKQNAAPLPMLEVIF